ncbi:retrovirus-related pol polyprotein from transposon TNT 1-94 [Tanacetum coccineum]
MKEIGKSSRIDDEVVQDQRQQDDNDLQDERHYQSKEEEVEPRRSKRAKTKKSFRPDFVSFIVENEPTSYREASKLMLLENFNEDYSKCLRLLVEVAAAKVRVTATKQNLMLFINATGTKLQLLEEFILTDKISKTYRRKNKDCLENKITYEISRWLMLHEGKEDSKEAQKEVCLAPRNQENRNRENTRRVVLVEITTSNALVSYDGSGYDWSDQAVEEEEDKCFVLFLDNHDEDETGQINEKEQPNNDEFETNESNERAEAQAETRPTRTKTQPSRFKDYVVQVPPSVKHPTSTSNQVTSTVCYPISNFVSYAKFFTNHKALLAAITNNDEPKCFKQDARWREAMQKEVKALEKNANRVLGYLKATPGQGILISRAGDPVLTLLCDSDLVDVPTRGITYSSNSEVSTDSNCSSSCLENVKILKEQNEQLLKDLRTSLNAITYKTGLDSVEARLLVYKKNESIYEEDIKVLKRKMYLREVAITELRRKLELVQKQKDKIQLTVENFKNSSKKEFVNEPIVSEPTVKKPVVETSEAKASADKPKVVRKNFSPPLIEDWISDSEDDSESKPKIEKKTVKNSFAKTESVKSKEQVKSPRKTTTKQGDQNRQNTHNPKGNQRNWNNMMSQRLGSNFDIFNKACYVCGSFDHLQVDCKRVNKKQFQNTKFIWNNANRVNHEIFAKKTHPCPNRNMVSKAVLMRSSLVSLTSARPVNAAQPRTTVNSARPMTNVFNKAHSTVRRLINNKTTFKNSNINQRVNIFRDKNVNAARPKAVVNTVRPKAVLNVVKGNHVNAVKASACWAESINIACYVQNRVLVVKLHNKTPYELFHGRTPTLSFIKLFGCPVTILNTIDHLGKFDGKADEGFFVGYSINSKAFRYFDIDALTKSMNYKPIVVGNQSNDNAGTKACDDAGKEKMETIPGDDGKKVDENPRKDSEGIDQEKEDNVNSTNNVNAGVGGGVEGDDDEDVGAEADMNNLDAFMPVSRYTQEEGIDYDEVFAPVARIEAIRIFLVYASFKDFVVYQMDVKSTFLYGKIEDEVYVCQPPGFEDPDFPDRVYKVEKSRHQALLWKLKALLKDKKVCACARYQVNPKVSHLHAVKRIFSLDRKSTTGGCQFLGCRLISWQCKKQTVVANSTTEAEYVAASSCYGQVLWIQNQLLDYGYVNAV